MTHMLCGLVIRGSEWDLDSKLHMRSAGGLILTWFLSREGYWRDGPESVLFATCP